MLENKLRPSKASCIHILTAFLVPFHIESYSAHDVALYCQSLILHHPVLNYWKS